MTPEEKANQIYFYYVRELSTITVEFDILSKKFALNYIDDILNSFNNIFDDYVKEPKEVGGFYNMRKYWKQVKIEIEKI